MSGAHFAKLRHSTLLAALIATVFLPVAAAAPAGDASSGQRHYDRDADCSVFDAAAYPADEATWDGPCVRGLASGHGAASFETSAGTSETISANFRDGMLLDGDADIRWSDGRHYVGGAVAGRPDGKGLLTDAAGDRFDGNWRSGALNGHGAVIWANGDRYDGEWLNGKAEGPGSQHWANGQRYEGLWHNDQPSGQGTLTRADGTRINAIFADGKPTKPAVAPPITPANPPTQVTGAPTNLLGSLAGSTLTGVDGSTVSLETTRDGFVRTIRAPDGSVQTASFTFLGEGLGSVSQGGNPPRVTGVFHLSGARLASDYADGHSEALTLSGTNGLTLVSTSPAGESVCTAWYAPGHVFSFAERKAALAVYARRLGISGVANAGHMDCATMPTVPSGNRHTAMSSTALHRAAPHLSEALPAEVPSSGSGSGDLQTVPVKPSTVHVIDTAPPAVEPSSGPTVPADERVASNCLTVDTDGSDWGFRNHCSYSVQYSFCLLHGADDVTACPANGSARLSGSVSPNGFGPLFAADGIGDQSVEQKFRWVGCRGGAGEVVAHLDQAEPPSGRCVGRTRVLAQGN
jgi:hypothetical protein